MHATVLAERQLSALDAARLRKLGAGGHTPALDDLLDEAEILEAGRLPTDLVTLDAQTEVEDIATRSRRTLVVCDPDQADPAAGRISVLSPVGTGLLGLRVGGVGQWRTPTGQESAARVIAVLSQPQPAGEGAAP